MMKEKDKLSSQICLNSYYTCGQVRETAARTQPACQGRPSGCTKGTPRLRQPWPISWQVGDLHGTTECAPRLASK